MDIWRLINMKNNILLNTEIKKLKLFKKGKVRNIYEIEDKLLIVATDRISAFDVVLPNGIPYKGKVLTELSCFWFDFTKSLIENHLISNNIGDFPKNLKKYQDILRSRSMLVKKTQPIPVECVVRGYLAGSGWREYKDKKSICGIKLPKGLKESDKLPKPIFTPATKAKTGHDENITEKQMEELIGRKLTRNLKEISLLILEVASKYAESKGIIIADTKFEFGIYNNKIILIDEILTPDSSRFWPKDDYKPGRPQVSFDKQYVRDYLQQINWDKNPPAPKLPELVVKKTSEKYFEVLQRLTKKGNINFLI
jgi:phosphoribosylaminoimidazole-succinocarboxamide synthase